MNKNIIIINIIINNIIFNYFLHDTLYINIFLNFIRII